MYQNTLNLVLTNLKYKNYPTIKNEYDSLKYIKFL